MVDARRFAWLLGLVLALGSTARAEEPSENGAVASPEAPARRGAVSAMIHDVTGDFRNVFTSKQNLVLIAAGSALTAGAHQFDDRMARSRFNSELDEETALDHAFEAGGIAGGGIVQIGGAVGTYGLGMLLGKPGVTELGRDLVRAQVVTQTFTVALKAAVGRERPDHSNRRSFPSGHASASFATATILQKRYGAGVGVPAYAVASYIAASRMNESAHFLSDVVFGVALGLVGGRSVTVESRRARVGFVPVASTGFAGLVITFGRAAPQAGSAGASATTSHRRGPLRL